MQSRGRSGTALSPLSSERVNYDRPVGETRGPCGRPDGSLKRKYLGARDYVSCDARRHRDQVLLSLVHAPTTA